MKQLKMSKFYQEETRARLSSNRISESDEKRVLIDVNVGDVSGDVNTAETINYRYYNVPEQAMDAKAFESYHEQFKSWLKKETKKLCSYSNLPGVKEPVKIVPLQLSSSVHHWSNDFATGHYHHRKEVSEMLNSPIVGNVQSENFFKESKKYAEHSAESKQFEFQEAKEEYINQVGNFVGIAGEAGMGKTTLTKQLLQQALDKDKPLYNAEYVFYVPFRNLNYKKETSFLHFLAPSSLPSKFTNNHKMMNMLLDELNDCDNVCLIMDGFDEADLNFDSTCESKVDVHDNALAEHFIRNLLLGKIFTKAKKIISSRPRQLYEINKKFRPNFMVNIVGLDLAAQKLICGNVCKEKQKEVFSFIQNHPDLSCICCIPFNCIMICLCVKTILEQTEIEGPQTLRLLNSLTCILTIVYCRFMHSEHVRENLVPENLATLAWNGLINKKLCFDEKDLSNAGLKDAKMNTYLVTLLRKDDLPLLEGLETKFTFFSHLIVQEFYSALKILCFMSFDDFLQLFDKYDIIFGNEFEIVSKFLFGLLNKETFKYLKKSGSISCDYPLKQVDALKEMLLQEVVNWCPFFLKICHLVYEMRDDKFREEIAEKMDSQLSITGELLPTDVVVLCYVLQARKSSLVLILETSPWFNNDLWASLFGIIQPIFSCSAFRHIDLHIDLSFTYLLWELCPEEYYESSEDFPGYDDYGLKPAVWTAFWNFLETVANPVQKLNLYNNPIDCNVLAKCLSNVQELQLVKCQISENDVKTLSSAVQALSSPLKKLDLSENVFGDPGISALVIGIHNILELHLVKCGIKSSGMKLLAAALQSLHSPMKHLDVSGNNIGDAGLCYVTVQSLENVEEFNIARTNVSTDALNFLSDEIETLRKQLQALKVSLPDKSPNPFSENSVKNIAYLYINCRSAFFEKDDTGFCSKIEKIETPSLRHILGSDSYATSSSKSKLDEDGLKDDTSFIWCGCLHHIDKIILEQHEIQSRNIKRMLNEIKERKTPLKHLELRRLGRVVTIKKIIADRIDLIEALSSCIVNVEELVLYRCQIGNDCMRLLAPAINLLRTPMKLLIIIDEDIGETVIEFVFSCLRKIERLVLIGTDALGNGLQLRLNQLEYLLTAVNNLIVPLKELQMDGISNPTVTEATARKLQKCRSKIINLKLDGRCIFSSKGYVFCPAAKREQTDYDSF